VRYAVQGSGRDRVGSDWTGSPKKVNIIIASCQNCFLSKSPEHSGFLS
jgi:hypothetical protein